MYQSWLADGFARPGAGCKPDEFEIATNCQVVVTDDIDTAVADMKPALGLYIGGMGAKDMNFHKDVFGRMGYEAEVEQIQTFFLEGRRNEAVAAVPDQLVCDISLIGQVAKIRDDLASWEEAGVTTLVVMSRSEEGLAEVAEAILG
jgi:alkanesulfonate monooxygenase SsuD/methylene tetrahydromethanopterin reductase-like flavin-dependent oxidoreductase (luciferase family)